jgi:hypothetical protein
MTPVEYRVRRREGMIVPTPESNKEKLNPVCAGEWDCRELAGQTFDEITLLNQKLIQYRRHQ